MSTWEVFRRLVRDARPIYGWLLLGALLGGIVVACTVIAPKLLGQGVQLLYDAWAGERPKAGLTEALLPICGALAGVYLLKSIVDTGKMVLMNNVVSKYYTAHCASSFRINYPGCPSALLIRPRQDGSLTVFKRMFPIWAAVSTTLWM